MLDGMDVEEVTWKWLGPHWSFELFSGAYLFLSVHVSGVWSLWRRQGIGTYLGTLDSAREENG